MFIDLERRSLNGAFIFLHLGLQLVAAYWSVVIDGYSCQEQYITIVSYFGYALIGFNAVLIVYFLYRTNTNKALFYGVRIINALLCGGILFFTIEGYNKFNTCAPSKALYEVYFIETVIALVLLLAIIIGKVSWEDRYAHWPGNLTWAILFLKVGFPGALATPALVIGILYAVISVTSFIFNAFHYNTVDLTKNKANILTAQWVFSMIVIFGCEVLAVVMLVLHDKDGDYAWNYARKIFVIFAAINIVDFFFWFYGYRRLTAWINHTVVWKICIFSLFSNQYFPIKFVNVNYFKYLYHFKLYIIRSKRKTKTIVSLIFSLSLKKNIFIFW